MILLINFSNNFLRCFDYPLMVNFGNDFFKSFCISFTKFFWSVLYIAGICNGVCIQHKAYKLEEGGRYANGQKRCQCCDIYINWDGIWCPCCNYRLRSKPRNKKYRDKYCSRIKKQEVIINAL